MPHLSNCAHMSDGWCLTCVGKLWEEKQSAERSAKSLNILSRDMSERWWTKQEIDAILDKITVAHIEGYGYGLFLKDQPANDFLIKLSSIARQATLAEQAESRAAALAGELEGARKALQPFAEYIKGVEPREDGMRISIGMLSKPDHTGWEMTTDGLCVRHLIDARKALAQPG